MRQQTKSTDDESAPTNTGSTPSSKSMKARSLALLESLTNGSHNPFERVDPAVLQAAHRLTTKRFELEDMEEAPL